jgi:hypothetical protein
MQNLTPSLNSRLLSLESIEVDARDALSYPTDPSSNISWSGNTNSVADVQAAFNNARAIENSQLGTSIPMLTLPSQTSWSSMSDGEKALWLINRERIDRGVMPLHGLENNVNSVAQYYADYLLNNNAWGHQADGRDPWERLSDNPAIGACHDFLSVSENLAAFVTSGSSIALPIERTIFMWMYTDGDCCSWGHRHAVLWYPYNDNSGPSGREGFLGIGRANGGPYQGGFQQSWPFAEIIVMNVFDPCASWSYLNAPGVASLAAPSGTISSNAPAFSWNVSPDTENTDPATWYYLWVDGPSGNVFNRWYEASAICAGSSCSVTPVGLTLGGGNHTWWVQTWNDAGYGPWSEGMTFTSPAPSLPGKATLVSPKGSIGNNNPTYTWNEVTGATWYYLWINGPSGNIHQAWYNSAQANCNGSTCSVANATPNLGVGAHTWWVQTWSSAGYGPWSDSATFTPPTPTPPGKATLNSPSGSTGNTNPTYTWNQVSAATWYYLWVDGPSGHLLDKWYSSADANCNGATCSVANATPNLSGGTHTWWIQTWSSAGYGPWSDGMSFALTPPEKATLVSPNGSSGSNNPTYRWNEVPGATWYYLWVDGPSGHVFDRWYTSAQANCNGTTCLVGSTTPNLSAGSYTWWIQTWSSAGYGPWSNGMSFSNP